LHRKSLKHGRISRRYLDGNLGIYLFPVNPGPKPFGFGGKPPPLAIRKSKASTSELLQETGLPEIVNIIDT